MQLWDLVRVAQRQRRVLVPLLIVTAVLSLAVGAVAGDDYVASGTVGLVGPSQSLDAPARRAATAGPTNTASVNPYLTFSSSLPVTAVALARRVQAFHTGETLADAGLSTQYEVFSTPTSPLVRVEASGTSSSEALATLDRIIDIAEDELARLQSERDAPEGQFITLDVLEVPTRAAPDSAGKMKVRLTLMGVGALVSITIAFAVEGIRSSAGRAGPGPGRRRPAAEGGPAHAPAVEHV